MKIVIPMAGKSSRFYAAGYKIPKFLIKVKGKTLMEYSLKSLPLSSNDQVVFIALKRHDELYKLEKHINITFPNLNFNLILLENETRGQSETVMASRDIIDEKDELLIYNIDTCFKSKTLKKKITEEKHMHDGVLGAFINRSEENHWSFAKINKNKNVIKVREKVKISDFALTGLYHFSKAKYFFETAEYHIRNNLLAKGEFYIAPLYNDLILKGKNFKLDIVDEFIPLGTPKEVKIFERT